MVGIKNLHLIAVVPARSGSKGIVDKNLQKIEGFTLLELAIHSALKIPHVERVICSTDSQTYAQVALLAGAEVPYLRPPAISGDRSTDFDFFSDLVENLKLREEVTFAHIRPTTPLRDAAVMSDAILEYQKLDKSWSSLRSVHKMSESAFKSFTIDSDFKLQSLTSDPDSDMSNLPRQVFPDTFVANGYIDLFPSKNIAHFGSIHGPKIHGFVTPVVDEIDTFDDLLRVRALSHYIKNVSSEERP